MSNCAKCNGSGKIPFIKNGKVIVNTWEFCPECYETHQDNHISRLLEPSDIDFPVSYPVWRSLCQLHGWQDPGRARPNEVEAPLPTEVIHRHSDMSRAEFKMLQQTARKADWLEKKLIEVQSRRKPEGTWNKPRVEPKTAPRVYEIEK